MRYLRSMLIVFFLEILEEKKSKHTLSDKETLLEVYLNIIQFFWDSNGAKSADFFDFWMDRGITASTSLCMPVLAKQLNLRADSRIFFGYPTLVPRSERNLERNGALKSSVYSVE